MNLYLDTSSLIKLCVHEAGSDAVVDAVDEAAIVATSPIAYAETRAALSRLRRDGALSPSLYASTKRDFEEQWSAYLKIEVTDSICYAAGDLAEAYGLRGFDSLHLASFAEMVSRSGVRNASFSSFDDRLNQAARKLIRRLSAK